jgi:dTDP-4-amino-4,6-dideoxygalactose transaminase
VIPFFPPDLFDADRQTLLDLIHRIGTEPAQRFILGPRTARLESELRTELGAADVIACGSGTGALTMILHAMGIGAEDEVIVPAFGCAPLASTVVNLGAIPVFADVDPWTMVADPDEMARSVTARTRALVPAHVFSVLADMPRLRAIADRYDLRLVEDSAVAQGARLAGRPAGLWGDAGLYSFVQVKTFGMPGEGGVVVTGDPELGRTIRLLRNHGQDACARFLHHRVGYNSRFDEVQAAFQLHRLPRLPERLARRRAIGGYYTDRFAGLRDAGILAPPTTEDGRCFYVYSLLAERRDELRAYLRSRGVDTHVYYPLPLPRQPAFERYAPPGSRWPHAESASRRTLALPIYPHLTDAQVEYIADAVCDFAHQPQEALR